MSNLPDLPRPFAGAHRGTGGRLALLLTGIATLAVAAVEPPAPLPGLPPEPRPLLIQSSPAAVRRLEPVSAAQTAWYGRTPKRASSRRARGLSTQAW